MEKLSDDLLGLIFGKLSSKYDRKSCTRVCSQWRRVESATRSSIKILDPQYLPFFLPRYRNLRVIEAGKGVCDLDLELIADICPLLQILNLNLPTTIAYVDLLYDSHVDVVTDHGISELAPKCKHLREIHLKRRKVVGDLGLRNLLKSCHNLVHLDIAFCNRITDQSLEAIAGSGCLEILVLQGCTLVTDRGICLLADGSAAKSLKTLDLSECDRITDSGVEVLPKFSCLKVVSLAASGSRITDNGVTLLGKISTLETVNISWLVNVSDESLFVLARSCRNLKEINISGSELVTGDGIAAFSGHPCLQALILDACYNILAEDIEQIVLGCSSLEYLGLDRAFRYWISNDTLHRMEGLCRIEWL